MNQQLDVFSQASLIEMTAATPVTFNATSNTATRATGSWIDEGFEIGQTVLVAGSEAALTLLDSIVIGDAAETFTRTVGDFLAEGFIDGTIFAVTGSASNNSTFTVAAGGATALVLTVDEDITVGEAGQTDLTMISTTDNDGTLTIINVTDTVMTFAAVTVTLGEMVTIDMEVNSSGGQASTMWAVGVRGNDVQGVPEALSCVIQVTGTIGGGTVALEYFDGHNWNDAVAQDSGLAAISDAGDFTVTDLQGVAFRLTLNSGETSDTVNAVVIASVPIYEVAP
jgi:hypothetical protein